MPELPEVQTIVDGLNRKVRGLTIAGVWTDWPKYFKRSKGGFSGFKKEVEGRKILKVWRLGKNIIFDLSGGMEILIHQKMTGHMLIGKWGLKGGRWVPTEKGPMEDRINGYIHAMFSLSKGRQVALSDLRKFAKILVFKKESLSKLEDLKDIGPDPLSKGFDFLKFKTLISKKRGVVKKALMDQSVISGIGNIYADDILFLSQIHPLRRIEGLSGQELKRIFDSTVKILKKAVRLRGASTSDYRDTSGKEGGYAKARLVYQKEGEKCPRLRQGFGGQSRKCEGIIKRIKIGGRSAHFCPACQRLKS